MADTIKNGKPFDPSQYLVKVKGNDYLPVAARIAWFRSMFPNGTIDTEILHLDTQARSAIVKATIVAIDSDGQVLGRATGIKEGTPNGAISDFVELGETGSIGRALASLGFGTLQAGNELGGSEFVVDSPIDAPVNRGNRQQPTQIDRASIDQKNMIVGLGKKLGMVKPDGHHDGPRLDESLRKRVGTPLSGLTKKQASEVIDMMQKAVKATEPRRINTAPPTDEEMDAALNNATPGSLPFDVPDDRHTR